MRLINGHTIEEASRITADIFAGVIREKPDAVLGLATGSTPIGLYEALTDDYRTGLLDFSRVSTINLDEYVGLSRQHEQSFGYFMDKHFFSRVNIPEENIMLIDGNGDPDAQADRYEAFFDNRSIDVLILGIGNNGHIGFNEPESVFRMKTHRVALVESTIEANSRFFASKEEVPRFAVTMGMRGITSAKKIVLEAFGENKAEAVRRLFAEDTVDPMLPCSILKLCPDVTVVVDEALYRKLV